MATARPGVMVGPFAFCGFTPTHPIVYVAGMATTRQTSLRLTDDDERLLSALQSHLGVVSRSELIRMALRELAKAHGVPIPKP